MSTFQFESTPFIINSWLIVRLSEEESLKLPSRGQVMVEGEINGHAFTMPLEPDGRRSHWFRIDEALRKEAGVQPGESATLELTPTKDWPEPDVPADIMTAVKTSSKAAALWESVTPLARWEWIRWIRSTASDETRKHRIEVAISKMEKGEKRPCCWNRNLCTEPAVSKSGVLLEPQATSS